MSGPQRPIRAAWPRVALLDTELDGFVQRLCPGRDLRLAVRGRVFDVGAGLDVPPAREHPHHQAEGLIDRATRYEGNTEIGAGAGKEPLVGLGSTSVEVDVEGDEEAKGSSPP